MQNNASQDGVIFERFCVDKNIKKLLTVSTIIAHEICDNVALYTQ